MNKNTKEIRATVINPFFKNRKRVVKPMFETNRINIQHPTSARNTTENCHQDYDYVMMSVTNHNPHAAWINQMVEELWFNA